MRFTSAAIAFAAASAVSATLPPDLENKLGSAVGGFITKAGSSTDLTIATTAVPVTAVPAVVKSFAWSSVDHNEKTWASEIPYPTGTWSTECTTSTSAAPVIPTTAVPVVPTTAVPVYSITAVTSVAPVYNATNPILYSPTLSTSVAPAFTGAASSNSWSAAAGVAAILGLAAL
ncbi:hypothetical protein EJ08DRAFT_694938 [Tothia fuscella]|uniref:Uncharacterized protein n=1 Tax=Tothia fuscella TaxID=1048955 RepID=A0A9P4NWD9_9PEZI|nr:hypothetical protein EJ08DRAFT_694938 [Tothia fuscella]